MTEQNIDTYAELARLSGVRNTQLSNYRHGLAQPSRESLQRLAGPLGVPPVELWIVAGLASVSDLGGQLPDKFERLAALYRDDRAAKYRPHIDRQLEVLLTWLTSELGPAGRRDIPRRRRAN